tara:strand:+ start:452 stop:1033 length:582 start_codon:yes stop_codon:yes gene_type:complete
MEVAMIVLGRFQPFHRGHAAMINAALEHLKTKNSDKKLRICIGSSEAEESLENPWTANEREQMIRAWLDDTQGTNSGEIEIVQVPDLNDPPNYVKHAEKFHGTAGTIFTSDQSTAELYEAAGWSTIMMNHEKRERWQGWRVRATIQMMSTITDEEAVKAVLTESIPEAIVDFLIENDGLRRLAFMGHGGEPVG